jgi:hypothetical protein
MQQGHGQKAWAWTYNMDIDMQLGYGHAACTGTCRMDTYINNGRGHAAWRREHAGWIHGHGHSVRT